MYSSTPAYSTVYVSVIDTSIHTLSCSWNSQSHDLQSAAGMCLIEHIFPPEPHLITEPASADPASDDSHRPFVTKRLQSELWARAVMTFITRRKIGPNFRQCDSVTCTETHTVVQAFRQVCMDWKYRLIVQARSYTALFSLFDFLSSPAQTRSKRCYKIKAWVVFISSSALRPIPVFPRAADTSAPCRPSCQNQGINLPTATKTFSSPTYQSIY